MVWQRCNWVEWKVLRYASLSTAWLWIHPRLAFYTSKYIWQIYTLTSFAIAPCYEKALSNEMPLPLQDCPRVSLSVRNYPSSVFGTLNKLLYRAAEMSSKAANKVAGGIADISIKMADSIIHHLGPSHYGEQLQDPKARPNAAKEIAGAAVVAASGIYDSMEQASRLVLRSGGQATSDFVGHRWGLHNHLRHIGNPILLNCDVIWSQGSCWRWKLHHCNIAYMIDLDWICKTSQANFDHRLNHDFVRLLKFSHCCTMAAIQYTQSPLSSYYCSDLIRAMTSCSLTWRYGPAAGEVANDAAHAAVTGGMTVMTVEKIGIKKIARRIAKRTATGLAKNAIVAPKPPPGERPVPTLAKSHQRQWLPV